MNAMNILKSLLFYFLLINLTASFSQENDDMYFNKKDRVAKKVKKITPAETILSKYRSGITNINNSEKIIIKTNWETAGGPLERVVPPTNQDAKSWGF